MNIVWPPVIIPLANGQPRTTGLIDLSGLHIDTNNRPFRTVVGLNVVPLPMFVLFMLSVLSINGFKQIENIKAKNGFKQIENIKAKKILRGKNECNMTMASKPE